MLTRRRVLGLLPGALASLSAALRASTSDAQSRLFARKPRPQPRPTRTLVYFGTDTDKPGARGIYVASFESATGQLSAPVLAAGALRPSYLAWGRVKDHRILFAVNEGDLHTSAVSSYSAEMPSGVLRKLGQVSSGGAGPCALSVDPAGHSAYVANYDGGTVASFQVQPDGNLAGPVVRIDLHDSRLYGHHGPNPERQDGPHPHSVLLSPDSRFLVVDDLGNDSIAVFPIDPATAQLGPVRLTDSRTPGSGPRHAVFHPNGRWVYGIDELSSKIDQYLWNTVHGAPGIATQALLTDSAHSVSTLAPGFRGVNTAAEIAISEGGHFVYASNRGEDSLVVFAVRESDGSLSPLERIPCGGSGPRHFTLDPSGRWLICGNQLSNSLTVFARDPGTGRLRGPLQTVPLAAPMFTLFA